MFATFLIFLGGGIGAAMRHGVNLLSASLFGVSFPWSTFIINILGSLLIGVAAGWFAFKSDAASQSLRLFLTTGILGGFTTFSAFSLDFALLAERGELAQGVLYVVGSVALSLIAVFAGLYLVRSLG
jgi:CrcB protein